MVDASELRLLRAGWRKAKATHVQSGEVDGALHRAVMAGDTKLVEALVAAQSLRNTYNLAALDGEGLTVMHQAVFAASLPMLDVLLLHGGDVNSIDEEGCTLLHTAAMVGNCLLAGWLIKKGAGVIAIDNDGNLPIDLASDVGMQELLQLAMHSAGYVGLALHYKSRLDATCDSDDSDYGTASSMSSLTLEEEEEEDDEENRPDGTFSPSPNEDEPKLDKAEDSAVDTPSGENPDRPPSHPSPTNNQETRGYLTPVHLPVSELAYVESIAAARSGMAEASTFLDSVFTPKPAVIRFHSALREVVKDLRESALTHERLLATTRTEKTNQADADMNDVSRRQPVAVSSNTVVTTPKALPRRSHTVTETDFGFVSGAALSSGVRSQKGLLRRSSLSGCGKQKRNPRRKNVSFPVEVLISDAIAVGDIEETRHLLDSGDLCVNALLPSGLTALHLAVLSRQRDIVRLLLARGAAVDISDADGWKPLHAAAREGTVPITNILLEFGADPLALTDDGKTARSLASNDNVRRALSVAMENALAPKHTSSSPVEVETVVEGCTAPSNQRPAHHRSSSAASSPVEGSLPSPTSKVVSFPPSVMLRQAITDSDEKEVEHLLSEHNESSLALNCTDLAGITPLHQAVLDENLTIAKLLLNDKRVNIHVRDVDGWTPMHAAAATGAPQIVQLLIESGASTRAPTTDGQSPLQLTENQDVRAILTKHRSSSMKHCTVSDL